MASLTVPGTPPRPSASAGYRRRRVRNTALWSLCGLAALLVVGPVVWLVEGVVANAVGGWRWSVLVNETTGVGGGLSNAIVGTLVLIVGVAILAGLVGIGSGIYISEIAPRRLAAILRGASEVLAGIPSIVFGYVGYVALAVYFHWGFSLGAALVVMSLLVVPYVAKSTELALSQVPLAYREGSDALGLTKTHALRRIVLRAAVPGIATGIIIAMAISVGETAPLLYTAGFANNMPSLHWTHSPIAFLTYAVWTFFDEPTANGVTLAHDAALILVVLVLALILLARLVVRVSQRHSPERQATGGRRGRGAARRAAADMVPPPAGSARAGPGAAPPGT
jgi:phosphate transport system permease protein